MLLMNLEPAYAKAKDDLARAHPETLAAWAEVSYLKEKRQFIIPFLGREYLVSYPEAEVQSFGEKEVSRTIQILLLHYLIHASPAGLEGRLISFKELPDGYIYTLPFTNRVIKPMIKFFAQIPQKLVEAGEKLGGKRGQVGDFSVSVPVLPKIPITFVIWVGDEEFPPAGNVLFDASARNFLDTEDYAVLPGIVLGRMKSLVL